MEVNVCASELPDPLVAPFTPTAFAVHVNVAPEGFDVNEIPVVAPVQIACAAGVATTTGAGLIVTTKSTGNPGQPANVGVTV